MADRKLRNIDAPKVVEPTEKECKPSKICPFRMEYVDPYNRCIKDSCAWWKGTDCSINFIPDIIGHYTSLRDTRDYWPHAILVPGEAWHYNSDWEWCDNDTGWQEV